MHPVEVKRRMGESDIAEVSQLLQQALVADGHYPLGEHKWLDLVHGGRTGFAGFVAREPTNGPLVGYAQLSRGHDTWGVEVVIRPDHRKPGADVGISLLSAALLEVGREGGGHVHLWVPKPTPDTDAMAETCGLRRGRDLYQMRRPLPVDDDHDRIDTRPFVPGMDEMAWLEVNNRAFASHPEQGGWSLDTIREREAEAWFDPEGFLLHERDGRLAASCWTKVHHDTEPPLGEIYVISVDPDLQSLGLGRALVLAGLDHLSSRGITVGMLYVDADNVAAVHLYRQLGFDVDHTDRAYVTDVAPSS
ncbi:MAG TPA: mycothiol synthase [Acidimicrobiales bacterium]|nr:mycothiol synthase [Acidimicrobiales bacterium]